MQKVAFKAGETIIREGDEGDTAFFIVSGAVDVAVGRGDNAEDRRQARDRRSVRRNVPDRAGAAIRDRHRGLRHGMPRRLLSGLRRRNRGEPGTRRRVHEDAGAASAQDERIARARRTRRGTGFAPCFWSASRPPAPPKPPPYPGRCCGDFPMRRSDNGLSPGRIARSPATIGGRPAIVPIISSRAWITGVRQYML